MILFKIKKHGCLTDNHRLKLDRLVTFWYVRTPVQPLIICKQCQLPSEMVQFNSPFFCVKFHVFHNLKVNGWIQTKTRMHCQLHLHCVPINKSVATTIRRCTHGALTVNKHHVGQIHCQCMGCVECEKRCLLSVLFVFFIYLHQNVKPKTTKYHFISDEFMLFDNFVHYGDNTKWSENLLMPLMS